jgi:hypothetical protein
MELTQTGLLVIPMGLLVLRFWPERLPQLAVVLAVMDAASVVNIRGGFTLGVTPYFFMMLLIAPDAVARIVRDPIRFAPREPLRPVVRALTLFATWGVITAFVCPILFAGIPVDSPRLGPDRAFYYQMPLSWSGSNGGQAAYLILDILLLLHVLRDATDNRRTDGLFEAYSWSGLLVVIVGFYQFASHRLGLPFPEEFINSNVAWGQSTNQHIGSLWRISATFVEPSSAGAFLAAWSIFELSLCMNQSTHSQRHWTFAVLGTVTLAATTSTTGYLAVGVMWLSIAGRYLSVVLRTGILPKRGLVGIIACIGIAVICLGSLSSNNTSALDIAVSNKSQTDSAAHRLSSIPRAMRVLSNTLGLGAGIGSNRCMSAPFYMLSNLGVFGTAVFAYALLMLCKAARSEIASREIERQGRAYLKAALSGFAAVLLCMTESGAEITGPILWLFIAVLLAGVRKAWFARVMASVFPPQSREVTFRREAVMSA